MKNNFPKEKEEKEALFFNMQMDSDSETGSDDEIDSSYYFLLEEKEEDDGQDKRDTPAFLVEKSRPLSTPLPIPSSLHKTENTVSLSETEEFKPGKPFTNFRRSYY